MKVFIVLADGFEEIEGLTCIDVLRRASVEVDIVGLKNLNVFGAHGVNIVADKVLNDISCCSYDMVVLPGGMPGAKKLSDSKELCEILYQMKESNKKIAAICAAPLALEVSGVLGNKFTCYPGFESSIRKNKDGYTDDFDVVVDGNIITAKGPALSMKFALELVKILKGNDIYIKVRDELLAK